MTLPPALLQRLAQRGLVQKQKKSADAKRNAATAAAAATTAAESEEVIAENYDELETEEQHGPERYEHVHRAAAAAAASGGGSNGNGGKRAAAGDDNWLERMKARMGMGDTALSAGYKGCPNKYNVYHKCSLFCVNRWADGRPEPSRDYMRRYRRLRRKYPLPKGWIELYDAGCGSFYFGCVAENLVSWLPPTHPKSQVSKTAAAFRRQLEDAADGADGGSDGEQLPEPDDEEEETAAVALQDNSAAARHQREIDDIINATIGPPAATLHSAQNFPSLQDALAAPGAAAMPPRKQKSRDLERTMARSQRRGGGVGERPERERDNRGGYGHGGSRRRGRGDADPIDPMDPSSYSDIPRGKWSDGLPTGGGGDERKKSCQGEEGGGRGAAVGKRSERREERSDDEDDERGYR